jgi:outer membrane lipoprotein SlyB
MTQKIRILQASSVICAIWILFVATASAQTVSRSQLGSAFEIRYGTVERVDRVKVQSQASQGAVTGGLIGAATSGHHHRGKHALEGALAGALLTAILEGNRQAYQYTVDFDDGSITKVVIETGGIEEGDCVSVELGQTANIRRVSDVQCEHRSHEALVEPIVYAKRQSEAAECHTAKEQALQATTEEATDIALKKVRVFCEG